jgi:hypothetical protein
MIDLELSLKALQAGILPAFTGDEVAKLLETCDPKEAYKLKRKFRKMWRKEMKAQLRDCSTDVEIRRCAASFSSPSSKRNTVRFKLLSEILGKKEE